MFYFANPEDNKEILSIFHYHLRFTAGEVTCQMNTNCAGTIQVYDHYNTDNFDMSYVWFMDALNDTLMVDTRLQLVPYMTGPELFMTIVSEVLLNSIHSLHSKEQSLEQLTLTSYPAENVKPLNTQILDMSDDLDQAGCLPQDMVIQE